MTGTVCLLTWILVLLTLLQRVLSVLILTSFLNGVCNLCVCVFFLFFTAAVGVFSLACPADYCFIVTHRIYCHSWRLNVNLNVNWDNDDINRTRNCLSLESIH